jgi:hypothetical protein
MRNNMQYTKNGGLHRLVRITGPAHNLLGIEFGGENPADCIVERLGTSAGQRTELSDEEVKGWVLLAVAKANAELGTTLIVQRIQYVADDTRDEKAYALMARELVLKAQA